MSDKNRIVAIWDTREGSEDDEWEGGIRKTSRDAYGSLTFEDASTSSMESKLKLRHYI